MSMEEIRTKASILDTKVKQWHQVGGLMVALLLVKNAWEIWVDTDLLERGGDALMFLALVYVVHQFLRYARAETSPAMLQEAARLVRRYHAKPVGTEITVDLEGKLVTARIERHFHPEGGPVKPWGFHPGVSLFIAR